MWQNVIIALLVIAAAVYVVRALLPRRRPKTDAPCSACGKSHEVDRK